MSTSGSPWLFRVGGEERSRFRLICAPHAGSGPSPYVSWRQHLPSDIELWIVALPGREGRLDEAPLTGMPQLLRPLGAAARAWRDSSPQPYAVLGHSMGALIAFELAQNLSRSSRPPECLVVSGHVAPHLPALNRFHLLPDDEFVDQVLRDSGELRNSLDDPQLRALYLPALRADFQLTETYRCTAPTALNCPIITWRAYGDSTVPGDEVALWSAYSTAPTRHRVFRGDHFFALADPATVLSTLVTDLGLNRSSADSGLP